MPAAFNKFQQFAEDLAHKVHDLIGTGATLDDVKIYLSNDAPIAASDAIKSQVVEITIQNGYTGPVEPANLTGARSGGTVTLSGDQVVITATGAVGPFQYVVLYNDTPGSPLDPLIGWWDYASPISLGDGETFTWKPNSQASGGTILTIA